MKIFLKILFFSLTCFFSFSNIYSQWVELNSGVSVKLNSISSVKNIASWVCGDNSVIIRSTNTGDTWVNGNHSGIPAGNTLNHIYAINSDTAFVCGTAGNSAALYKTTDAGLSWQVVRTQVGGKFNALYFIDNSTGILTGDPVGGRWSIWKTVNGGIVWDSAGCFIPQANSENGFSNSLWAAGNIIWTGTDNYRMYLSTNFGISWAVKSTGSEKNSSSLWFDFDYNIGYSGNDNLIKTTNSGNSWFTESIPGTGPISGVTGSAHARYNWAIRENKIYVNPHNENTWIYDYTSPSGNYTYITIEKNGYFGGAVFAIRDNGGISRTIFIAIGIQNISNEVPEKFNLQQNYPNPFNPSTIIRFEVPVKSYVTLEVYDVNGRKIESLTKGLLTEGIYEAEWNAENFSSGIYFCRLMAEKFSSIKKMILLK